MDWETLLAEIYALSDVELTVMRDRRDKPIVTTAIARDCRGKVVRVSYQVIEESETCAT